MKNCDLLIFLQFLIINIFLSVKADVLSSKQKPPIYASNAGGLSLPLPKTIQSSDQMSKTKTSNVIHEETETYKTEGSEFIRVITGKVAYTSPEGLPVSIKYMADENGNKASFTIGNSNSGSDSSSNQAFSQQNKSTQPKRKSNINGSKNTNINKVGTKGNNESYLPPNQKKNPTYLPPTKS